MLKAVDVKIEDIYVPAARRQELDPVKADALAEKIMDGDVDGERQKPLRVRKGKGRYVLIDGIHRLEACKALGDETICVLIVQAPRF